MWKGVDIPRKSPFRRLTRDEVSKACGMNYRKISRIANRITWNDVTVADLLTFCDGCNFDFLRLAKVKFYLSNAAKQKKCLPHLTQHQLSLFGRAVKAYDAMMAQDGASRI